MNLLKICILEPTKDFHNQLIEKYKFFFEACNYTADIDCFTIESELHTALNSEIIDIVISDLALDSEGAPGLLIIRDIKELYPDVYCIGNSRTEISYRETTLKLPNFDLFIDKSGLFAGTEDYLEKIRVIFLATFKRNTNIECKWEESDSFLGNDDNHLVVRSLISQVTFSSHTQDCRLKPEVAELTLLAGGRSKSWVYKMNVNNRKSKVTLVPSVLKISKKEYALKEIENYNRFVKWVLPYSWRVDILGSGITKEYGAICYSFILSGDYKFDALTEFIKLGKYNCIKETLRKLFNPSKKFWYNTPLIDESDNINELYTKRYFRHEDSQDLSNIQFINALQELMLAKIERNTVTVRDTVYEKPINILFGTPHGKYQTCICHGDLNSNNVILAENGEIIFIDFQETGRGHVFEDFIAMEASIRLNYKIEEIDILKNAQNWENLLEIENKYNETNSYETFMPEMYSLVDEIRSMAKQNFPDENWSNYHYGIAAYCFRLFRIKELSNNAKGRLLVPLLVSSKLVRKN